MFEFDKIKESCFCHVCIEDTQFNDVCENNMYVKAWQHTQLNTKGKIFLSSFEEMESKETIMSSKGVSDLVREGNISIDFNIYMCVCVFYVFKINVYKYLDNS